MEVKKLKKIKKNTSIEILIDILKNEIKANEKIIKILSKKIK